MDNNSSVWRGLDDTIFDTEESWLDRLVWEEVVDDDDEDSNERLEESEEGVHYGDQSYSLLLNLISLFLLLELLQNHQQYSHQWFQHLWPLLKLFLHWHCLPAKDLWMSQKWTFQNYLSLEVVHIFCLNCCKMNLTVEQQNLSELGKCVWWTSSWFSPPCTYHTSDDNIVSCSLCRVLQQQ